MPRREFPPEIMDLVDKIRTRRKKVPKKDIEKLAAFVLDEDAKSGTGPMAEIDAHEFVEAKGFHITDRILGYRYISGEVRSRYNSREKRSKPRSYLALVIPPGRRGIGIAAEYLREYLEQGPTTRNVQKMADCPTSRDFSKREKKQIEEAERFIARGKLEESSKPD